MPYLKSWSGMRRYLEEDMLCDSLKGRVRYSCTRYWKDECFGIFEVFADNISRRVFSMDHAMSQIYKESDKSVRASKLYWADKSADAKDRKQFDDQDFAWALGDYRSMSIKEAAASDNPIIRMFAVLDRRLGKRSLLKLRDEVSEQPDWLQFFYKLRLDAEGINIATQ